MKQFELGNATEILFVMPFNKFEGVHNLETQEYIQWLKKIERQYNFLLRYRFYLEDGEQLEGTYQVMFVHLKKAS